MPAKMKFAHLPTPVEPLTRLTKHLGGPRLLIKRDDQTGLAFGGNKTRKLEFLVGEAKAAGAKTLVTTGAIQSNHCRQTAAAAARSGMGCVLVLTGEPPAQASANLLLDHLLGAEIQWTDKSSRDASLQGAFERARLAGKAPYLVPYGGSSPTGALAYAYALQELLAQGPAPDGILFASSSGGTQAGLVAGAGHFGFEGEILGVSVDEPAEILTAIIRELAPKVAALLGEERDVLPEEIVVTDSYLGEGYAVMGDPEREAIQLFARQEGILLDPVYTGRAAAGMIDLIRKGRFKREDTLLFWHTGGTPALFSDRYRNLLAPSSRSG